jgi:hypothetical protein
MRGCAPILEKSDYGIVSVMALIIKVIIILLLVFILFSLGSALYYLVHDRENSDRIVKALTWRIGLSLLLFAILFFAFAMGWISPHPL